jgi:hypothetical protein
MTNSADRTYRGFRVRVACTTAVALVLLSIGGAAVAHWRTTGAGTGTGTAGRTLAITLTAGSVGGDLYPGGSAAVSTSATNSGSAEVQIVSLLLDTSQGSAGFAVDAAHSGCDPASFSFTAPKAGGSWTVPANSTLDISYANAVTMSKTAANACQGATVTVYLVAGS